MALLELAPNHKTGLALRSRAVAASGCWGFADEYAGLVDFAQLGAFITNPLTYAPRQPAAARAALPFPGGVLLHTGLPNPGLRSAVQTYAAKWARMPCPVIVHLALNSGAEVTQCLALLEQLENVAALELGFRADEHAHTISELVRAACAGMLPVLAALPFERAAECAPIAARAGVQVLSVSAPPRGTLPGPVSGRLYGHGVFPGALHNLQAVQALTDLPLLAGGGVHTPQQAQALLAAGAAAVQLDSVVWSQPAQLPALLQALAL